MPARRIFKVEISMFSTRDGLHFQREKITETLTKTPSPSCSKVKKELDITLESSRTKLWASIQTEHIKKENKIKEVRDFLVKKDSKCCQKLGNLCRTGIIIYDLSYFNVFFQTPKSHVLKSSRIATSKKLLFVTSEWSILDLKYLRRWEDLYWLKKCYIWRKKTLRLELERFIFKLIK